MRHCIIRRHVTAPFCPVDEFIGEFVEKYDVADCFMIPARDMCHYFVFLRSREAARAAVGEVFSEDDFSCKIYAIPKALVSWLSSVVSSRWVMLSGIALHGRFVHCLPTFL